LGRGGGGTLENMTKSQVGAVFGVALLLVIGATAQASAAPATATIGLGSAQSFSIVASTYVTVSGSYVSGDVATRGAITSSGSTIMGAQHPNNDPTAQQAIADASSAYTVAVFE